jgi:hypothetical protein
MAKNMDMERFNLKKLNNNIRLQSKTSLQPWKTKEDNRAINRAWDTTRDIKI